MNIEQEIWEDFNSFAEGFYLQGEAYEDRRGKVSIGFNKKLDYDEDYRIDKFLATSGDDDIDWNKLMKLYPFREKIYTPNIQKFKPAKYRSNEERVGIDYIILNDWKQKKEKLFTRIPDDNHAHGYLKDMRWGDIIPESPFNIHSKVYECAGGKYKCKDTGKYFTVKTGTIFEGSNMSLLKWFEGMYLLTNVKTNKISTYQLARALEVTQKTAWVMANKIQSKVNDSFIDMVRKDLFK